MILRSLVLGALLAASLPWPALADPPPWAGHGRREREWRRDQWEQRRWERERWERREARRAYREGYYAPAPRYRPPPAYAPPGIGVFVPFR